MKNFVISLLTVQQRREHIEAEFSKQKIEYEFFDAITPATTENAKQALGFQNFNTHLHPNEVACLLSHMMLWKKAVDEKMDYVAIFEDDIYLGEKSADFLLDNSWIPKSVQILKLEVVYKKVVLDLNQNKLAAPNHRSIHALAEPHMGAGGYILSQEAARKLLDFVMQSKLFIPVDHILFREFPAHSNQEVYQLIPALCIQDVILTKGKTHFPSALEDVRNQRKGEVKTKKKLNFAAKINREFRRIFVHLHHVCIDYLKRLKKKQVIKLKFK